LEVGVVVLFQDVDGQAEEIPVQGFFQDTVVRVVPADGSSAGYGDGLGVFTAQDGVVGAVGVAATLAGQGTNDRSLRIALSPRVPGLTVKSG